jgi:hypothetical protein
VLFGQVDNLVGPNLPAFREIYKGSLERMKSESLLDNITDADTITQVRAISMTFVDFVLTVLCLRIQVLSLDRSYFVCFQDRFKISLLFPLRAMRPIVQR